MAQIRKTPDRVRDRLQLPPAIKLQAHRPVDYIFSPSPPELPQPSRTNNKRPPELKHLIHLRVIMAIEEECILGGFMARRPELPRKSKDHPLFNKRKPAAAPASSSSSSPNSSSSRKKKRSRTGNGVISDADNPTTLDPDDTPTCQKWGSLVAIYARLDEQAAKEKKPPAASRSRLLQPRLKDGDWTSQPAAAALMVPSSSCQSHTTSQPAAEAALLVPSSSCQSHTTSHPAAAAALVPSSSCQSHTTSRARTILAVLVENKILPPAARMSYRLNRRGPAVMQGTVTIDGNITCACGCGASYTVADFAAHARAASSVGVATTGRPSANIFLGNRRSLSECLVQLMRKKKGCPPPSYSGAPRVKRECGAELADGDGVCSVCADGGDLVLCECCPSAFHLCCVGLEATPTTEEDWFCPSCRCTICDSGEFEFPNSTICDDADDFTDKTVIYCDQCERQFHVGCIRRNRGEECCPKKEQPKKGYATMPAQTYSAVYRDSSAAHSLPQRKASHSQS